ncbi:MAG: hypothetical protein ABIH56_06695 [Candidatus Margulisiibacteriota bacterium]
MGIAPTTPTPVRNARVPGHQPVGEAAIPTNQMQGAEGRIRGMLAAMTGKSPNDTDKVSFGVFSRNRSFSEVWKEVFTSGRVTRENFEKLMKFYGVDEVTDEMWNAFSGGSQSMSIADFEQSLSTYQRVCTMQGYNFGEVCESDKIYVLPTAEFARFLQGKGVAWVNSLSTNPQVRGAWERAKAYTGAQSGEPNEQTWRWFAIELMLSFGDAVRKDHDLGDLNTKHPLVQNLFERAAVHWAETNEAFSPQAFDKMEERSDRLTDVQKYYDQDPLHRAAYDLRGIRLTDARSEQLLDEALAAFDSNNQTLYLQKIGELRRHTTPVAIPGENPGRPPITPRPITPAVPPPPAPPAPQTPPQPVGSGIRLNPNRHY